MADGGLDHHTSWHPLPDFTPRALFHDLLVPEVRVLVPDDGKAADIEEQLPVALALREFAPGRVSRRLAVHQPLLSHWVEPEDAISLETWMPQRELIGRVEVDGATMPLYRPWSVMTREVPRQVSKSSFGALDWQTTLEPQSDGVPLNLPAKAAVAQPFLDFRFFLHSRRNPVTVTRFAAKSHASRVEVKGSTTSITSTFFDADEQRVAIGFIQDVDGFSVTLNVPTADELCAAVTATGSSAWRTAFMRYRITTDPGLTAKANGFELSWIADAVTLAVTTAGLSGAPKPLDRRTGGSVGGLQGRD